MEPTTTYFHFTTTAVVHRRAVPIGATAAHASASLLYASAELRAMFPPPITTRLPAIATAAGRVLRHPLIDVILLHVPATVSYTAAESEVQPPPAT